MILERMAQIRLPSWYPQLLPPSLKTQLISHDSSNCFSAMCHRFSHGVSILGHMSPLNLVLYSPTGEYFLSVAEECMLKVYNAKSKILARSIRAHPTLTTSGQPAGIYFACISSDGALVATCGPDRNVRVWSLESFSQVACLHVGKEILYLEFRPLSAKYGRSIACACKDAKARVFSTFFGSGGAEWNTQVINSYIADCIRRRNADA